MEIWPVQDVSDDVKRQQWAMWNATIWWLLERRVLTQPALELIRQELRTGRWQAAVVPESHRTQHTMLLHHVTNHLAVINPTLGTYYEGAGDLLPPAPDSPAGLDGAA